MLNVLNPQWDPGNAPVEKAWLAAYGRYEVERERRRNRRRAIARKAAALLGFVGRRGPSRNAATDGRGRPVPAPRRAACPDPCDEEPCLDHVMASPC